jgi:glycosyltransferase involved in cell wall biosynthesis
MKISVFFDNYLPFHELKDVGQIPLGLMEVGEDTAIITVTKPELAGYHPKFGFVQKPLGEFYNDEFWRSDDSDVILAYPLQGKSYSPLLSKMKAAGKKVILKFDSDGKIAYPLQRHIHRIPLRERLTFGNVISEAFWLFAPRAFKRKKHTTVAAESIRQMELVDRAIIESPLALNNLKTFYSAWGHSELGEKASFIPNPVSTQFIEGTVGKKENLAITHGRWEDTRVKNTAGMAKAVAEFLNQHPEYRFMIFGSGMDIVKKHLEKVSKEVRDRIELSDFVPHAYVKAKLAPAKLLFLASRWESFSIAAAEAVCCGCSIVGTPAEALQFLSNEGSSGTIAVNFSSKALIAALNEDVIKWGKGSYDPQKIAAYWRPKVDRKTVAKSVLELVQDS